MLNDICKLAAWDDMIEQNDDLRRAYNEQVKLIAEMSKAIHQAKAALDTANTALLWWIDMPDEEVKKKQKRRGA